MQLGQLKKKSKRGISKDTAAAVSGGAAAPKPAEEKPEEKTPAETEEATPTPTPAADGNDDGDGDDRDEGKTKEGDQEKEREKEKEKGKDKDKEDAGGEDAPSPSASPAPPSPHARPASIHARRASAAHYRRPSVNSTDVLRSANKSPLSPTDVPDIYHRQAETISALTTENETLAKEVERLGARDKRLAGTEADRDRLQEQLADVRQELRAVAARLDAAEQAKLSSQQEMDKMVGGFLLPFRSTANAPRPVQKSELETLNRQTSHLGSQVAAKDKTIAGLRLASSGESTAQDRESLTARDDQIENMEIDLNKLRSELERAQKSLATAEASLTAHDGLRDELAVAQSRLEAATSQLSQETSRCAALQAQLRTAQADHDAVRADLKKKTASIASLDKDYYTLKSLYRDAEAKSQEASRLAIAKSRQLHDLEDALADEQRRASQFEADRQDLRLRLERALADNRRLTAAPGSAAAAAAGTDDDDTAVDELEDAERSRLRDRIRLLEEQLDAERKRHRPHHTLQAVLPRSPPQTARRARATSLLSDGGSLLSDDADFGEMMKSEMQAARAREEAAAEERRRAEAERLERIREVKRGLDKWKGWRMDLTLVGGSAHGLGEMFEV